MSVTVEFSNDNQNEGGTLKVSIQYNYGDYEYSAINLHCVKDARNYAERMIVILEKQRLGKNNGA